MSKTVPFLWFEKEAEAAARFYVSLLPDSKVDGVTSLASETPSGPPGSVKVIDFTLAGQPYAAMEAGGAEPFNHSMSLMVLCDSQDEIDRLWDAHLKNGGSEQACGWLKDRWGVSWQVTPTRLLELVTGPDRDRAARALASIGNMCKINFAEVERAADGA